jgi:hypothetical protein
VVKDLARCLSSDGAQISRRRLAALSIGDELKKDLLALIQSVHPCPFDRANVNEHILAAVARLDEAKSFLAVEPLYGSFRHNILSQIKRIRACLFDRALSRSLFKSSFGKIISPTLSARRGQIVPAQARQ